MWISAIKYCFRHFGHFSVHRQWHTVWSAPLVGAGNAVHFYTDLMLIILIMLVINHINNQINHAEFDDDHSAALVSGISWVWPPAQVSESSSGHLCWSDADYIDYSDMLMLILLMLISGISWVWPPAAQVSESSSGASRECTHMQSYTCTRGRHQRVSCMYTNVLR